MSSVQKNIFLSFALSIVFVVVLVFTLKLFIFSDEPAKNDETIYREAFKRNYKIFAVNIPDSMNFAGEIVPLDNYWIRESLDRELLVNTYWHSNTLLMIKRAYRFFPIIEPIIRDAGLPDDLKYIAVIESGLTQAVSPAKATGFWQFMKATAEQYGLTVNNNVDERYHIEKSTVAACKFLKSLHRTYQCWALASAAYNMGPAALNRQISFQQTESYYDLLLNAETARYFYRILAIKLIIENPKDYGFYLRKTDMYLPVPVYTIEVDSGINDLVLYAKSHDVSYRTLKEYNPWLRERNLLNRSGEVLKITLPVSGYESWKKQLSELENPNHLINDTMHSGQIR